MATEFYTKKVRNELMAEGMQVDETFLALFIEVAKEEKLTQKQFDRLVLFHARGVRRNFQRSRFTWKQRICMALYWLGAWPEVKE